MALIPRLAGMILVSALVAGCSQSLFDLPGDDDGNGEPDARDDEPKPPDAGVMLDDAGNVIRPDANPEVPPDAAVPTNCPEPCLFDAVADFAYSPDAISGSWVYAEEVPSPFGTTYSEMRLETRSDGTQAFVGQGSPAFVHCPSYPGYVNCNGVEDKLLFETTEPGAHHPALVWLAPQDTRTAYRLSGDWRVPSNTPTDTPMSLLLVRNSQFDSMLDERFFTRTMPAAFDFEIDVQPGEILRLIAISGDASHAPLALSLYVSEAQNPGRCQMATSFDDPGGSAILFPNLCASSSFLDNVESDTACPNPEPTCPATVTALPPTGIQGRARTFGEGASIEYQGPPNSYRGDWTVQFWAYLDSAGSWTTETLLADQDCLTEGGIGVYRYLFDTESSEMDFDAYYDDSMFDRCLAGPARVTTSVSNDEWHFFRLARSTATETMSVCVDGQPVGDVFVPGTADMSATESMWLGRNVTYEPAYFRGRLADLRVFDRALPCANR
jgi:hypothetical protein